MATSAAILDVLVRADTRAATTAIKKYQTTLNRTDQSITSTTRTTGALGKATRTTGSRLASAARYAAGAAAAYLSIAQAKAAITTTQDLAKTTAGLNRNLGFTVKEGSRWAAVAKSRDIDAKALTMSFTTLSRRVVDAGAAIKEGGGAAETAMAPFSRLGISQREVVSGAKDLDSFMPRLADAFGDAAGGAERQASAQQLLGRGYATVLPLFADGAKGLQEQQKWADRYGTTLNEKTLKAQMDLVSAQRESKVAWLGIQMAFAQGVTPALEKANDVFQRIAAIMASDKLTNDEKFKRVGEIIEKWADTALDAFVEVLPHLIERAAEAAPKIAAAIAKGIMEAPIWGTLLLGGWLLKGAAFSALGSAIGGRIAGGIGMSLKTGLTAGGVGLAVSGAVAAWFTSGGIQDTIEGKGATWGTKFGDAFAETAQPKIQKAISSFDIDTLKALRKPLADLQKWFQETGAGGSEALNKLVGTANRARERISEDFERIKVELGAFSNTWGQSLGEINRRVDKNMQDIERSLGLHSRRGRQAVSDNFLAAVQAIKNSMKSGEISAEKGARAIHNVLVKQLKSYGIKDVEGFLNRQEQASAPGAHSGLQRGGAINAGRPTGDSVPAMLERGEYVLNRNAVAKLGRSTLDRINFNEARRFQGGGMVDPAGPGTGVVNPAIADVVGAWSRRYDAAINYGYDPGGGHLSEGHNVTGTATDTGPAGGWVGRSLELFEQGLRSLVGKVPQILYGTAGIGTPYPDHGRGNHAHIEWGMNPQVSGMGGFAGGQVKLPRFSSDFGLGMMVAGGLNNMAAGTEKSVNARLSRMGAGAAGDMGAQGSYKGPLNRIFPATSLASPGAALTSSQVQSVMGPAGLPGVFLGIAQDESGWHPGIIGYDPGGTRGLGLWQITTGYNDDIIKRFGGEASMRNPVINAQAAKAIFDRQPSAWAASGNAMAAGGIVGFAKGGGPDRGTQIDISGASSPGPAVSFGGAHEPAVYKKIRELAEIIATVEDNIGVMETTHAFASSEMGSDLSGSERVAQIFGNSYLLDTLREYAGKLKKGMGIARPGGEVWEGFKTALEEVEGPPLSSSKILSVTEKLDALTHPDAPEAADTRDAEALLQLQLAQALGTITRQRTALLSGPIVRTLAAQMPSFAGGGVMPGPPSRHGPAMVGGGEGIFTPEQMAALGNVTVEVVVEDGAVDSSKIRAVVVDENRRTLSAARRRIG